MKYGGSNSETKTLTKSKKYSIGKSLKSYICMYLFPYWISVKKNIAQLSIKHVHFLLDILIAKA